MYKKTSDGHRDNFQTVRPQCPSTNEKLEHHNLVRKFKQEWADCFNWNRCRCFDRNRPADRDTEKKG